MKKKMTEAVVEKMRGLVLRGVTGVARSTPKAPLGDLLGTGLLIEENECERC